MSSNPSPTAYCCVTSGKGLNASELQFPQAVKREMIATTEQGYLGDKMEHKNEASGTSCPSILRKVILPSEMSGFLCGLQVGVVFVRQPRWSSPFTLPLLGTSVSVSQDQIIGPQTAEVYLIDLQPQRFLLI